ncbi:hypothetical protein R3X25_02140 [Lutibacter sp. TH_r2]|uniref:hypothetical protein n=1 Tax=Lutibacter sp. TH_r2 TaxID=3082083 RepID=UPI002953DAA8|nr:hypothetical protein [Lutibacter sp. TH_r2]MDV7186068.1 hypothetical protein [Lutibacter sp. TH_r2]
MKKTFIGHKFQLLNSKKTGIILELNGWCSENMIEKYTVSFDTECKIERITKEHISIENKVSTKDFYNRLIRDIQSSNKKTREFASKILCDFMEFEITDININILKPGIEKIIEQIKIENNVTIEQILVASLFEFISSEKLTKKEEIELLERLTEINSSQICNYLNEEYYLKIPKVKKYVKLNKLTT